MKIAELNLLITLIWNGQRLEMASEYMRLNYPKVGLKPSNNQFWGVFFNVQFSDIPQKPLFFNIKKIKKNIKKVLK